MENLIDTNIYNKTWNPPYQMCFDHEPHIHVGHGLFEFKSESIELYDPKPLFPSLLYDVREKLISTGAILLNNTLSKLLSEEPALIDLAWYKELDECGQNVTILFLNTIETCCGRFFCPSLRWSPLYKEWTHEPALLAYEVGSHYRIAVLKTPGGK